MAWLVGDSWDYYGGHIDLGHSVWDSYDSATPAAFYAGGRFGNGQALQLQYRTPQLTKSFGSNEATVYIACAYYRPGAQSGSSVEMYFGLRDGATAQCTICFMSNGSIVLKSGDYSSGTTLATFASAFVQDTWNHFQLRVVIDPAAGTFTIRKNGSGTDTFAATGLNTRGGTANSYANAVVLGNTANTGYVDDFLCYSASGAAPNTWVGDIRAQCLPPVTDQSVVMTPLVTSATCLGDLSNAGITITVPANTICFTCGYNIANSNPPPRGGKVTLFQVSVNTAMTGNAKFAIYADANQYPGALLWTSNTLVNPASGTVTVTWPATMYLGSRQRYWIAVLSDTPFLLNELVDLTYGPGFNVATSFATGFPATAPASMTTGPFGRPISTKVTVSGNCVNLSETFANGDTDYVYSSNPGDQDLYLLDQLIPQPVSVIGVVSKLYFKKSDAGSRTGQLQVKSGTTQVTGPDTSPPTTYTYTQRVDTTDPNTGAAWTAAAVNALQLGVKVTS